MDLVSLEGLRNKQVGIETKIKTQKNESIITNNKVNSKKKKKDIIVDLTSNNVNEEE